MTFTLHVFRYLPSRTSHQLDNNAIINPKKKKKPIRWIKFNSFLFLRIFPMHTNIQSHFVCMAWRRRNEFFKLNFSFVSFAVCRLFNCCSSLYSHTLTSCGCFFSLYVVCIAIWFATLSIQWPRGPKGYMLVIKYALHFTIKQRHRTHEQQILFSGRLANARFS